MSDPIASSSAQFAESDDTYQGLLASVRARFASVVASQQGKVKLFTTRAPDLFQLFIDALPPPFRQRHTCATCRRFMERFGALVAVAADGQTVAAMWAPEITPEPFVAAIRALEAAVSRAPIDGVFLSDETTWGTAQSGSWHHLAVTPGDALVFKPPATKNIGQVIAEKLQDHETLTRGLEQFPLAVVNKAHALLTTEALYRSEACIGVAKWLVELQEQRAATQNLRARENLTWLAVAGAPPGFCHVRSTMIGTLLEDLVADLPFEQIKGRFDAKMNPLQYQRPTAAPSAGNIAQAEKIIEKLASAGALERRFATLDDLQKLWLAQASGAQPEKKGVFSHLKGLAASKTSSQVDVPAITMTWEKFSRTVLPAAESIEYFVPPSNQAYAGLVTAKNPEAPPILQWDFEGKRNPVSWYLYVDGTAPARWNLRPGGYHPVSAVALQPSLWDTTKTFTHHGEKVFFLLEGARDKEYVKGAGFFPSFLKSEYHEIRSTLEAYAKDAIVAGKDEPAACGICLQKGLTWSHTFRVTSKGGVRVVYKLDRWD